MTNLNCNVLVIGAGAAGATFAATLSDHGVKDIILLEKGPYYDKSFFNQNELAMGVLKAEGGARTTADGGIPVQSAECVGGGTTINYALCFDPIPSVWQRWRREHGVTEFSFAESASDYGVPGLNMARALKDVRRRINVQQPSLPANDNNQLFKLGAERRGLGVQTFELNMDGCVGCGFCGSGCAYDAKLGTMVTYVRDAEAHGVRLVHHCSIDTIRIESRAGVPTATGAIGVIRPTVPGSRANSVSTGPITITAKLVVVASGAAASPGILQQSQVPDPDDRIGRGVILHPSLPVAGVFPHRLVNYRGITGTYYSDALRDDHNIMLEYLFDQPVDTALALPGFGRDHFDLMVNYPNLAGFGVMLIDQPQERNRVTWDRGRGKPVISYQLADADKDRLRFGARTSVEIMFAAGATRVLLTSTERLKTLSQPVFSDISQAAECQSLQFDPYSTLLASAHIQASTKMGSAESGAFANSRGEAHRVRGLMVCDSSSFPTSCGANPMLAIMALARYQGLRVAAEWSSRYASAGA
jgi:choline dehydrogenase-like flavoprotein